MSDMEFTGERYLSNLDSPEISYEHWHRYMFAAELVQDKDVLDIACGEGYGSHLLAEKANNVIAVDISEEAVAFATNRYKKGNLNFKQGSVADIPVEGEALFDVIVSYETIEHVDEATQTTMLKEIKRLLKPDGLFIVSTPNKLLYTDLPKYKNEFHIKEFYFRELKDFLHNYFKNSQMLGQKIYPVSMIWHLEKSHALPLKEHHLELSDDGFRPSKLPKSDLYDIAICSDANLPPLSDSILVDINERMNRVKDEQLGHLMHAINQQEEMINNLIAEKTELEKKLTHARSVPLSEESDKRIKASVIIPVYNKVEYTQQCLQAMANHTSGDLFELIIVDNASTDQTGELLKALEGDVKIIRNNENVGFVEACNQGADAAAGKYLMFLNNDTIPVEGWLDELIGLMESDETIGAAGSKLVYPDGTLQEAGGIIFRDGSGWNFGKNDDPEKDIYNKVSEVDYCSGAALLVRRDLFEKIGGLDKRYAPAYYEDTDLCFAIRKEGFKVVYCPTSLVVHCEGATAGTSLATGFKQYQVVNREKFIEKWKTELAKQEESPEITHAIPFTADRKRLSLEVAEEKIQVLPDDKMNVLVIDPILPRYDRASGSLRLFNILKILVALGSQVTYIARNGVRQEQYKRELEEMGIKVYATDPEKMAALGCDLVAEKIDMKSILGETHYHLAWLSFYDVAEQYLPEIRKYSPQTKIMIDTVDVHFLRETRQAELHNDDGMRKKAKETRRRELTIYPQADLLMTVTKEDKDAIHQFLPDKEVVILPNIHEMQEQGPDYGNRKDLLFVGNFNHPPNVDAMEWFCQDVFPKIKDVIKDIHLSIVGANPPAGVQNLEADDIDVTGYVIETEPYIQSHRLSIAPLRYGAGMKGKIGEALSHGLPVVTTSIGAEGMGLIHGQHALIADDADVFAQEVARLYNDQTLWKHLAKNGKDHIENKFGFTAMQRIVSELQKTILGSTQAQHGMVSIILLAHNQLEYTQKCIDSIFSQTKQSFELVIVDNHSTDDTASYLEQLALDRKNEGACKSIEIISNPDNLGFSAGNNQGIAAAKGDYILLMNNDVVVTEGWLERMLEVAESKPQIGIVGPMSNYVSGPQFVKQIGYDVNSLLGLKEFVTNFSNQQQGQSRPYWRVVGFCMLIKREVINKIGGMDGRYGMGNFEDDDFSLRAALAGFESWIAEDVFIHHFGSKTFEAANIDYKRSLEKNWEIFKRKWNIPMNIHYGEPYEMTTVIQQSFKKEHFCPLTA